MWYNIVLLDAVNCDYFLGKYKLQAAEENHLKQFPLNDIHYKFHYDGSQTYLQ